MKYDKIIIVGSGKFPFQIASLLYDRGYDLSVFEYQVSQISILQKLCGKKGIAYERFDKESMINEISGYLGMPLLIISAFNTYLFPEKIIGHPNVTAINYHNAYLPKHPGRNAESWCIYEGDEVTGATWHYITENVDAGKIIAQEIIEITTEHTAIKLLQEQNKLAFSLFKSFIDCLLHEEIEGVHQEIPKDRKIHYANEVPNDGYLNLSWDIKTMLRFLRAMDYGILENLGKSRICHENRLYTISRYSLISHEGMQYQRKVIRSSDQISILESDLELKITINALDERQEK